MDPELLNTALDKVIELGTNYGLNILGGIVILIIGKIAAGICAKIVTKIMTKANTDPASVERMATGRDQTPRTAQISATCSPQRVTGHDHHTPRWCGWSAG